MYIQQTIILTYSPFGTQNLYFFDNYVQPILQSYLQRLLLLINMHLISKLINDKLIFYIKQPILINTHYFPHIHTHTSQVSIYIIHNNIQMARNSKTSYEHLNRIQDDLYQQISTLKTLSKKINSHLKQQQKTRQGLQQYLDAGIQGLKKTNKILMELLSSRSLFGCNTCILFGICLIVIVILMML